MKKINLMLLLAVIMSLGITSCRDNSEELIEQAVEYRLLRYNIPTSLLSNDLDENLKTEWAQLAVGGDYTWSSSSNALKVKCGIVTATGEIGDSGNVYVKDKDGKVLKEFYVTTIPTYSITMQVGEERKLDEIATYSGHKGLILRKEYLNGQTLIEYSEGVIKAVGRGTKLFAGVDEEYPYTELYILQITVE